MRSFSDRAAIDSLDPTRPTLEFEPYPPAPRERLRRPDREQRRWQPGTRIALGGAGLGTPPFTSPEGVGSELRAGDEAGIELHDGPATAEDELLASDIVELRLWFYPEAGPPAALRQVITATAPDFTIPAGTANITAVAEAEIAPGSRVTDFIQHIHALGQTIVEEVRSYAGQTTCMGNVPNWVVGHQDAYFFDPSATLLTQDGDMLRVTCSFDNSAANQPSVGGITHEPSDLHTGWLASNEMCMGSLIVEVPR